MRKCFFLFPAVLIFSTQFLGPDLGIFILHFLVINPIWSILIGIWSGMAFRRRWYFVPLFSVCYLIPSWIFLEPLEVAFVIYAFTYLALGIIFMIITAMINKMRSKK